MNGKKCIATWEGGSCTRGDIAAYGLCYAHTQQSYRGTVFKPVRFYRPLGLTEKQLAEWCVEVSTLNENDCLIWPFASRNGYPVINIGEKKNRKAEGVHRLVTKWYLNEGVQLNSHQVVHHICSNRICINTEHLEITTPAKNTSEAMLRREVKTLRAIVESLQKRIKELETDG